MPTIARIVGGPGAGKTTRLLNIIEQVTTRLGISPMQIGFVSFTRAARGEAAKRAGDKFNFSQTALEKEGYFRTLHSVCFRQLGTAPGELITGGASDTEWLRNSVNDPRIQPSNSDANDDSLLMASDSSDAGRALALWDACRNRLIPLETVWEKSAETDRRLPTLGTCQSTISLYEDAKQRDGRLDFCDLLMLFAGKKWTGKHDQPFEDCEPHGEVPEIPVWFHDEMQDCSLLTSLVFCRLIRDSVWTYCAGDRNQEIYSWSGADGRIFSQWPNVEKEDYLPISHRCDKNILDLGKQIIKDPRLANFNSASEEAGTISRTCLQDALGSLKAGEDCLVLARTNEYARAAVAILDDSCMPWKPTKGGGGFNAPARAAAITAILTLVKGGGIDGEGMHRVMDLFSTSVDGTTLFERGAKSHYADKEVRKSSHKAVPLTLGDLGEAGCTDAFKELLSSGKYVGLLEKPAARMAVAAARHGISAVQNPTIRVGTAHSSKGGEADHVILLNRIPYPTMQAIETQDGLEEERRVWYVSATRARHKLTIAEMDQGEGFPEL